MKLCCCWCSQIYTPLYPERVKGDGRYAKIYCCNGCRDADRLFIQYIKETCNAPDFVSKRLLR